MIKPAIIITAKYKLQELHDRLNASFFTQELFHGQFVDENTRAHQLELRRSESIIEHIFHFLQTVEKQ
jgi:hypothetical protein